MRSFKIAAAVATALIGGQAFALPATTAFQYSLVVAGASAQRDFWANDIKTNFCQGGGTDYTLYKAADPAITVAGLQPDFQASTCTLASSGAQAANVPASLQGKTAAIYYRSEGGSVFGVAGLVKGPAANTKTAPGTLKIKRLVLDGNCGASTCPVHSYSDATDSATGAAPNNLVDDFVELGVMDTEPTLFVGVNWPTGFNFGGAPLSVPAVSDITAQLGTTVNRVNGQVFSVIVNNSLANHPTFVNNSLSRQSLQSIFSGAYETWDQVPEAGTAVATPITVCRRDKGSGTQAASQIFFLDQGCNSSATAFVTATTTGNLDSVVENNSTTALENCVIGDAGGIGFRSHPGTSASYNIVGIDGTAPSAVNAATGAYPFMYETTAYKNKAIVTAGSADDLFIGTLLSHAQSAAFLPAGANVKSQLGLPGLNTVTLAATAGTATVAPIALGTRLGNSCKAQSNKN